MVWRLDPVDYLIGQLPSVTCSWAHVVALSWTVVDRAPGALGWVVALQFTPSLVIGPWFGTLADRYDRERLLMLAETGLGMVAAAYALAAGTRRLTLPSICLLATVWGVVNALDTPARRALVPMLVPAEQVASAAALSGVVLLLGMTAGSALGAGLVAAAGPVVAFTVNAVSFEFDVVLLATMRTGASPRIAPAPRQMREGLAYVWRTPPAPAAARPRASHHARLHCPGLGPDPAPHLVRGRAAAGRRRLHRIHRRRFGRRARRDHPHRARPTRLRLASTLMAAALVITAAAPAVPVALSGLAGIGFSWSLFIASTIAILQTAEPSLLGRVMSWMAVVLIGGTAAGGPLAGSLAALCGPRTPFVVGAVAALTAAWVVRSVPA